MVKLSGEMTFDVSLPVHVHVLINSSKTNSCYLERLSLSLLNTEVVFT